MEMPADKYIREHSTPQSKALDWLEKMTNIHTNYPRMLSGRVQGRFLTMLAEIVKAENILEIGTFTGYSAICLAYGLGDKGHIDTMEINDELEDLTREAWKMAGVEERITLHIGDARETIKKLSSTQYDLAYIDANKREYCEYFDLILPLIKKGGLILADDVLLGGKVYEENPSCDKQTQGLLAFNDKVANDPRVEVVILPIRDGLSLIRKI